jgi:hypothetical protein
MTRPPLATEAFCDRANENPEMRSAGEWSLVYLGGEYSHALHKRLPPGTILCHAERGGSLAFTPAPRDVSARS